MRMPNSNGNDHHGGGEMRKRLTIHLVPGIYLSNKISDCRVTTEVPFSAYIKVTLYNTNEH